MTKKVYNGEVFFPRSLMGHKHTLLASAFAALSVLQFAMLLGLAKQVDGLIEAAALTASARPVFHRAAPEATQARVQDRAQRQILLNGGRAMRGVSSERVGSVIRGQARGADSVR